MNKNIIDTYQELKQQHTETLKRLIRKHNIITILRLLTAGIVLVTLYQYIRLPNNNYLLYITISCTVLFLILMKESQKISWKKRLYQNLIKINEEEIAYLKGESISFDCGQEFINTSHYYAYDLDIFGNRSLFHHLNRTATYIGKTKLADLLLSRLSNEQILDNQQSLQELSESVTKRQIILATARITADNEDVYQKLMRWVEKEEKAANWLIKILSLLLPLSLGICLGLYLFTRNPLYWDIAIKIFPVNLLVMALQLKKIKRAMFEADRISEILKQYAAILSILEQTNFSSPGLQALTAQLYSDGTKASKHIRQLAKIGNDLASIQNPFGAVILNGLFLHHIHVLDRLVRWKSKYASKIPQWLNVIGEIETLNSLANLSYNNPDFVFPSLNNQRKLSFENLGHPLISEQKRVGNSVSFNDHPFIILTGSNMSGKSTFLRTLGVNMVLASIGSAICATKAEVHPMPILVSMRQSDSLADNESYFFAEVKRLKYIIEQLENRPCFVLLDEILRGTNSDDKRSGTVGVIEKIIQKNAIGAIATHDLEVCLTTHKHPAILVNKCFEVMIIDNELVFDYKLREGICQNKSATFLMKKMEII